MFIISITMISDPKDIFGKGYMTTQQLMCQGIPFSRIDGWLREGSIEKADRGVYCLPGTKRDDLALIQYRYDKCIFSGITALSLHGLTDHLSDSYYVTFPQGYNPSSLKDCSWNLSVTRSLPKIYDLGIEEFKTVQGNTVNVYDMERTICDVLRGKGIAPFILKTAFKRYMGRPDKDLNRLSSYADILHVKEKIENLTRFY